LKETAALADNMYSSSTSWKEYQRRS